MTLTRCDWMTCTALYGLAAADSTIAPLAARDDEQRSRSPEITTNERTSMMRTATAVLVSLTVLLLGGAAVGAEPLFVQVEDFDGPWNRQTNIDEYLGKNPTNRWA